MIILISGTLLALALLSLVNFLEVKFSAFQGAGIMKKILIYSGNSVLAGILMAVTGALAGAAIGDDIAGKAAVLLFFAGVGVGILLGLVFTGLWPYFAG